MLTSLTAQFHQTLNETIYTPNRNNILDVIIIHSVVFEVERIRTTWERQKKCSRLV